MLNPSRGPKLDDVALMRGCMRRREPKERPQAQPPWNRSSPQDAPEGRADWLAPHPAVAALVPVLKARGTQHVLDLGCGVGRHALLFAKHGFAVEGIDGATAGSIS